MSNFQCKITVHVKFTDRISIKLTEFNTHCPYIHHFRSNALNNIWPGKSDNPPCFFLNTVTVGFCPGIFIFKGLLV